MKKFEGYLICSDWDGTLSYNNGVSEKNVRAIKYFQENGGLFTISSGRHYKFLSNFYEFVKPNTPVISLCGTLIYDVEKDEKIFEGYVKESKIELIDKVMQYTDLVAYVWVCYDGCERGEAFPASEYKNHRDKIAEAKIYKLVFITETEPQMHQLVDNMKDVDLNGNLLVRSWPTGLEIYAKDSAKGHAVQLIKERTGGIHLFASAITRMILI